MGIYGSFYYGASRQALVSAELGVSITELSVSITEWAFLLRSDFHGSDVKLHVVRHGCFYYGLEPLELKVCQSSVNRDS